MTETVSTMDPVYERRELVRTVSVPSRHLQRSIQTSLLGQLKLHSEGRCGMEGYIAKNSVTILSHSLGRIDMLDERVKYRVKFQADVCMPHPGQVYTVPVEFKSKIGVHALYPPMKILLPRDLHLGNAEFDSIEEKDEVEIEIIGSQFQQDDTHIYVLGRLRRRKVPIPQVQEQPPAAESLDEMPALEPIPREEGGAGEVKQVVVPAASPATTEAPRRRKRLVPPGTSQGVLQINVAGTEGESKGPG